MRRVLAGRSMRKRIAKRRDKRRKADGR